MSIEAIREKLRWNGCMEHLRHNCPSCQPSEPTFTAVEMREVLEALDELREAAGVLDRMIDKDVANECSEQVLSAQRHLVKVLDRPER